MKSCGICEVICNRDIEEDWELARAGKEIKKIAPLD
jgi:ferredoxin-like protein FixX